MNPVVAVIDIGSNSIKVLVATRREDGRIESLKAHTIDARISAGISQAVPRLSEDGMSRGLSAIQDLLALAVPFSPTTTVLVATSAVRDAANGPEFRERVLTATGHTIRILTGDEEADLIGRGLTCDPALAHLRDFYVFDLGGGSLECLAFRDRRIEQELSLKLGCVRMTEKFITDPHAPLVTKECTALALHVRDEFKRAGFRFNLGAAEAVFTGGTFTSVRVIKAALHQVKLEDTSALVSLETLTDLLDEVGPLTLEERKGIPGMPAARADVFPAALITVVTVADFGLFDRFHHSLYNLRWGLAASALA
ncbi:Ppx/GppA phosphatase family protein [Rariglobus hedericola]|uniref:Phosphatase n=1 Tax=Rariglobus hedericola TaxID=2597822 RepID=A0A556QMT5_9BACT|nr:phosphatase [Rariglobus hedericola]TSJ77912.1 phosphatase [Rariglobus hedericola]